jgi:Trypsin-like peptidase domain
VDHEKLNAVRYAVCAIGYAKIPFDQFQADPLGARWEIVGTGFLADRRRVHTCAHVVTDMAGEMRKKRIPPEHRVAQFVLPKADGSWEAQFRPFREEQVIGEADVALLEIPGEELPVKPVPIVDSEYEPAVGDEIAICGYAHGSNLLRQGKKLGRFGPVLQRGCIAALVPFDSPGTETLLLDLATAHAASGSPVFRWDTGEVIGTLVEGQEGKRATISVARRLYRRGRAVMIPRGKLERAD